MNLRPHDLQNAKAQEYYAGRGVVHGNFSGRIDARLTLEGNSSEALDTSQPSLLLFKHQLQHSRLR